MVFGYRVRALAVAALLTPGGVTPASAGAWPLSQGEAKLFVSGLQTQGDHYYDAFGKKQSRGKYRKRELQVYGEYGVLDRLTVFVSVTAQQISANDGSRSHREGLGRSEAGARVRLFERNGWITSVQGSGLLAGAKKHGGPATIGESDDQFDARLLTGRNFELMGKTGYVDFETGYRKRSGEPSDEIRVDSTVGLNVTKTIQVFSQTFVTYGLKRWSGRYPLAQRIVKCQGGASIALSDKLELYGAAFFTPFAMDALDERGGQAGVAYRF